MSSLPRILRPGSGQVPQIARKGKDNSSNSSHSWQKEGSNSSNSRNSWQESTDLWALRDVSFEVQRGEVVGVIGRNGAGKSTLLKILSRITEPTGGRAEIHGRVGSLLEVGTGFHPELTGRENIYLNGAILGMHRHEIERKFDEIVAFAEIERFLDTPVKRYSSGMYVRLAFAVAAHLEPEILLVDEVLAVGDAEFQKKCLGKMGSAAQEGRTVLFVSHNMAAVQALCERGVLLKAGTVICDSSVSVAIVKYLGERNDRVTEYLFADTEREGNGRAHIARFRILDKLGNPVPELPQGEGVVFEFLMESSDDLPGIDLQIAVFSQTLGPVCHFSSSVSGFTYNGSRDRTIIRCTVPKLGLLPGQYFLNLAIYDSRSWDCIDRLVSAASFSVAQADVFGTGRSPNPKAGVCFFSAYWDERDIASHDAPN